MSVIETPQSLVRTVADREVPAPGAYVIDASHSAAEFAVRHLGLSKTRGRFADFAGVINIADDPTESSVEVDLVAASVDTRSEDRDNHLRSPDFFDVEQHPTLHFRSTAVRPAGRWWEVDGELTIRGITRPVTLEVSFEGGERDPWGNGRIAFTGKTEIDRYDYDLTWNQALETGGLLVGKKITIDLEVEAVRS